MDGSGGDVRTHYPVNGYWSYSQTGTIYTGTEIATITGSSGNGTISAIKYEFMGWDADFLVLDQRIYISHIDSTTLGISSLTPDYAGSTLSDKTPVYAADVTINNGWNTFTFDLSFNYTGGENILISWENHDGSYQSGYGGARGDPNNEYARGWWKDYSYPTATSLFKEKRPNIELVFI
jgi:hypothetical protein